MNAKQKKAIASKREMQYELTRQQHWPEVTDADLWHRLASGGFTTMPRTMPQIMAIIDALADKGKPCSQTYLALWFREDDVHMQLRVNSPGQLASESGFGGERAISTWNSRMQKLVDLGFIKVAKGSAGPFEYVLILNPYRVLDRLGDADMLDTPTLQALRHELKMRAVDVGVKDLDPPAPAPAPPQPAPAPAPAPAPPPPPPAGAAVPAPPPPPPAATPQGETAGDTKQGA